jgi:hypothetical protein
MRIISWHYHYLPLGNVRTEIKFSSIVRSLFYFVLCRMFCCKFKNEMGQMRSTHKTNAYKFSSHRLNGRHRLAHLGPHRIILKCVLGMCDEMWAGVYQVFTATICRRLWTRYWIFGFRTRLGVPSPHRRRRALFPEARRFSIYINCLLWA